MKSKNFVRAFPAALFALATVAGSPASAYDYNHCVGDRIDWGRTSVTFYPSRIAFPTGSVERSALDAAFDAWNNHAPGTRFRFATVYDDAPTWASGDGKNSVGFTNEYNWGANTLAVALRSWSCYLWGDGDLTEVDVMFRPLPAGSWTFVTSPPSPPSPNGPYYLSLVGIHELGHAFGLNHQQGVIGTMNDTYPSGGTLGNLNLIHPHSDDVYGNRVGYGTCCTERDVYANAYKSTSSTTTDWISAPYQAYRGYPVNFQFTIGNRGTTNEGSARVQYYLSTDRFISTSDTYLGAATFSLNSGGTSTFNAWVTIPASQPGGSYYLGWIVDPLNSIAEIDEANNAVALVSSTFVPANSPPSACFGTNPSLGYAPLGVSFDASCSSDPDGNIVSYQWNFGDGNTESSASPYYSHTYWSPGSYNVTLTVTDNQGSTSTTYNGIWVLEGGGSGWCGDNFCDNEGGECMDNCPQDCPDYFCLEPL